MSSEANIESLVSLLNNQSFEVLKPSSNGLAPMLMLPLCFNSAYTITCSSIREPQSIRQPILRINCKLLSHSTMTRGTGPPPPLGDHPNGEDISHPIYAVDSIHWHETPKQFCNNYMNAASRTLRNTNYSAFKIVGNATTWNRRI
jgi:hypothetical protein